jgi:hypothetical protein
MEAFFQAAAIGRDPLFCKIREAGNSHLLKARTLVETMWRECGSSIPIY